MIYDPYTPYRVSVWREVVNVKIQINMIKKHREKSWINM